MGNVILENNPLPPVGPRGREADFQVHNTSVRDFDLTNRILAGTSTYRRVISYQFKASSVGDWVCKHGSSTGYTCGWVWTTAYTPYGSTQGSYVQVYNALWAVGQIVCQGDSGSPVFEELGNGNVSGLGILSGGQDPIICDGDNYNNWFFYTPVNEIETLGYSILTTHYPEYYYQNVFWADSIGNCIEYIQPVDDNGTPISAQETTGPCQTSLPGSGTVQSSTGYIVADEFREGMWRGNVGYNRVVPLNANGTINWGGASAWTACCSGSAPRAQSDYIVGNTYYQNVFWTESNCTEYIRPVDNNGNLGPTTPPQPCRTSAPGSGTIQSYTAYVVGDYLREGMWRGNVGWTRNVPLNATKTDVNWGSAPTWSYCCSGSGPRAQTVFILNRP